MYTVTELIRELEAGKLSARQVTEEMLAAGETAHRALNLYITVNAQGALDTADMVDKRRKQGEKLPPLAGIPFAVKDNLATAGIVTTSGSDLLRDYVPGYSATVVEKLKLCPLLGKTNMDEFAIGSSTATSAFGPTGNPWNARRVPGGSSGGSAAVVAAGCAPFALGSDTGGSVRQPAAFCGVTGLKPTWGRVSRRGLFPLASSMDQVGILTRTVKDSALVLQAIAGADCNDPASAPEPVPGYSQAMEEGVGGLTFGLLRDQAADNQRGIEEAIEATARQLERSGARLLELEMPYGREALAVYNILASVEACSNLARFDGIRFGKRGEGGSYEQVIANGRRFGPEVKLRLLTGTNMVSGQNYQDYYLPALKARRVINDWLNSLFSHVDLLLTPATPLLAFCQEESDSFALRGNDYHAIPASLAGLPAISLPCGMASGLPVGMQLIAPAFGEDRLFRAGNAWQEISQWHLQQAGEAG